MKGHFQSIILIFVLVSCSLFTPTPPRSSVQDARRLLQEGEFKKAEQLLTDSMATTPEKDRKALRWEKERIRRIRLDYDNKEEDILRQCSERIKDFTPEDLKKWESEGKFDIQSIDGIKYYVSSSVSNLGKRYPEISKRFKDYSEKDAWGEKILEMAQKIQKAGKEKNTPYVIPLRLGVKHTITPKTEYIKTGEILRVWLPFPEELDFQKDIKIIKSNPESRSIDKPDSPIRSVFFELEADKASPPTITLEYEFTRYAICPRVEPSKVQPYGKDPLFTEYTREEEPHIVFTQELRKLAQDITGKEDNPYVKGKMIYDWVCQNIVYSYAREYSTLLNIPMYVYENRYGDCGQTGLFFITLCRIAGVPASWQSAWECMGGERWGMHDWAAIYIKPYGWIPVDPYMGVWAVHESTLPEPDRKFLKDFYYGNMDPWRLQANSRNNADLKPEKNDFRSEPVDFQRGEIECEGRNLYFGEFKWKMSLTLLKDM